MTTTDVNFVPDNADSTFDPGYVGVADENHGDEEVQDIPDSEVSNLD